MQASSLRVMLSETLHQVRLLRLGSVVGGTTAQLHTVASRLLWRVCTSDCMTASSLRVMLSETLHQVRWRAGEHPPWLQEHRQRARVQGAGCRV